MVRLQAVYARTSSMPSPVRALKGCAGTPGATSAQRASASGSSSGCRSSLVSTTTGRAPLCQERAR